MAQKKLNNITQNRLYIINDDVEKKMQMLRKSCLSNKCQKKE